MMIAEKYNKGARFDYQMPENAPFKKLAELPQETVITCRGMFISHKGKYGDSPVALIDGAYVNLPSHLTNTVSEMLKDSELVDAVNAGKVGFKVYSYVNNEKTCYSVNWVDLV